MRAPYFLTFMLAIGLVASSYKAYQLSEKNSDLASQIQDLEGQVKNLQSRLLKEHVQEETARMSQETLIAQLTEKVSAQRDAVEQAEERLKRERGSRASGSPMGVLQGKLQMEKRTIAELEQHLREVKQQQNTLRSEDKAYQQQAGATEKQTDEQLKQQITEQEQALKQLQLEVADAKKNIPVNPEYRDTVSELQAKISVQKDTIQQLKNQRSSSNADWSYQKQMSRSQTDKTFLELKATESQIETQLPLERGALRTLERDIQSGVQSQKSQAALIQSAQADVDTKKAALLDLENQLKDAQERLGRLGPASPSQ